MSNVLVADSWNYRVQQFDAEGNYQAQFGTMGDGDGEFMLPMGVAVDSAGNIYVTDYANHRVQKWDSDFNFLGWFGKGNLTGVGWHPVGSGEIGWESTEDGGFEYPYAICVDSLDKIYVTDVGLFSRNVKKFNADGSFVLKWGGWGTTNGKMKRPFGITVDGNDEIYVSDAEPGISARIQVFNTSGVYQRKWGTGGVGDGEFWGAMGMTVEDDNSQIFVCDTNNNRIQRFSTIGVYQTQWATDSYDITIDSSDQLYCIDPDNEIVEIFEVDGTPVDTFGGPGGGDGQFDRSRGIALSISAQYYQTLDAVTVPSVGLVKTTFKVLNAYYMGVISYALDVTRHFHAVLITDNRKVTLIVDAVKRIVQGEKDKDWEE